MTILFFHTYTSSNLHSIKEQTTQLTASIDAEDPRLLCFSIPSEENSLFFCRNLFHSSTGKHIGFAVLDIDADKLIDYCGKNLDPAWLDSVYNDKLHILSDEHMEAENQDMIRQIELTEPDISFQEMQLHGKAYYVAAQSISEIAFISAVAAPKEQLLKNLNDTFKILSSAVECLHSCRPFVCRFYQPGSNPPIEKMVFHINAISKGSQTPLPPTKECKSISGQKPSTKCCKSWILTTMIFFRNRSS